MALRDVGSGFLERVDAYALYLSALGRSDDTTSALSLNMTSVLVAKLVPMQTLGLHTLTGQGHIESS